MRIFNIFFNKNEFIFFLPVITIIGLIDDKYDLSANLKFLITIIFFVLFFNFNKILTISELRFSSFSHIQDVYEIISIPLTILCCLLLTNSINMIDGKNGLYASIQLVILFSNLLYN